MTADTFMGLVALAIGIASITYGVRALIYRLPKENPEEEYPIFIDLPKKEEPVEKPKPKSVKKKDIVKKYVAETDKKKSRSKKTR